MTIVGEYLETWNDFLIPGLLSFDGSRYMGLKLALPQSYASPLGPCQISAFDEIFSNPSPGQLLFYDSEGHAIDFKRPFNFLPSENAAYPHLQLKAPWLKQLTLKDRRIVKHFRQYPDKIYRLEAIEDLNGNRAQFHRNERGILGRIDGPDGLALEFANDTMGRRTTITLIGIDGAKLELARYAYDERARMVSADCAFGMSVRYFWHETENLLLRWHNLSKRSETSFTYDDDGRVVHTATSGLWNNDRFEYDTQQRITTYVPAGEDARAQRFEYDRNENVTAEIDALGGTVRHVYDKAGFRTSTIDENGHQSRTRYDIQGNVKQFTDAEGRHTVYGWGPHGELDIVIDGAGHVRKYDNDQFGLPVGEKDADGNETRFERNERGQIERTIFADGAQERRIYDSHGRLTAIIDAKGGERRFEYDAFGRVVSATDACGAQTRFAYRSGAGGFAVPSHMQRADGVIVSRGFDRDGQLAEVKDGEGRQWRYRHGGFGVLEAITDPKGGELGFAYDSEGRLASVTNALGRVYSFNRDAAGRVVAEEDFDGRITRYSRDAAGRVIETVKPDGARLVHAYDKTGLVTRVESFAPGEERKPEDVTRYWYDGRGLLAKAENKAALVEYRRDKSGRVIGETINGRKVESRLDALGRRIERRIGDALVKMARDPLGLVERLVIGGADGDTLSFSRDAMGRETRRSGKRGFFSDQSFDAVGQLLSQQAGHAVDGLAGAQALAHAGVSASSLRPLERRYGWDRANAPLAIEDSLWGATHYAYDAGGQVGSARYSDGISEGFGYDGARNLTGVRHSQGEVLKPFPASGSGGARRPAGASQAASGALGLPPALARAIAAQREKEAAKAAGSTTPGAAPASATAIPGGGDGPPGTWLGWQSSPGGVVQLARGANGERVALTHDACGRVIERRVERNGFRAQIWRYGWDAHDRLVRCTTPDGAVWLYGYDPFGRRIWKVRQLREAERRALAHRFPDLVDVSSLPERGAFHEEDARFNSDDPRPPIVGTHYLWDGDVLAEEAPLRLDGTVDWDAGIGWHFEEGSYRPLAKQDVDGTLTYIVTDHLGTPREMFSTDGKLVWAAHYATWGRLRGLKRTVPAAANDDAFDWLPSTHRPPRIYGNLALKAEPIESENRLACPFRFPGQYEDAETGLYYNRHRYYDPLAAQYISPDPIGLKGGDRPQGYVENPAAWTDPLGLAAKLKPGQPGFQKKWGPHERGPLGDPNDPKSVAATFRGGSYTEITLDKPIVVYRAHGGKARPVSEYMTTVEPRGPMQAIYDSALKPAWGNTATKVHQFELPAGTTIYQGATAPQMINGGAGSLIGGGPQIFVPKSTLTNLGLMP